MMEDPWLAALRKLREAMPDCQWPPDDEVHDERDGPLGEMTLSFCEQIVQGNWPVRLPAVMEIYAEGPHLRLHALGRGEERRRATSQIVTVYLEYDRAQVRDLMLESLDEHDSQTRSKLPYMVGLARVDRQCFLDTAAAHFVKTLTETDATLLEDRWLMEFLRELVDYDADLVPDLVAETLNKSRPTGDRLRDVILDLVDRPGVREHLGWLVAATLTERLQAA
jgi:hypothetical protein